MARIYLSPPHMGGAERELLLEAFDSNWIAPLGPMVDAFEARGGGLGTTFSFDSYPMRIDYIFTSTKMDVIRFETIKKTFSDHYPITATLGWN